MPPADALLLSTEAAADVADQPAPGDRAAGETLRSLAASLVRERGAVSTAEFERWGISRQYLAVLRRRGVVRKLRHGLYGPVSPYCD